MTPEEILAKYPDFDPNGVGALGKLFGLPYSPEEAKVVLLPVPWEVTVSYTAGTADGPQAILDASPQLDLYLPGLPDAWAMGISMLPIPEEIKHQSDALRKKATAYIQALEEQNQEKVEAAKPTVDTINKACDELVGQVKQEAGHWIGQGKLVGVVGGDHSTPLGLMKALAEQYPSFGILQIDAHADLREAYEGFTYSHASIMYNALRLPQISRLIQVGIRDICIEEATRAESSGDRIRLYYDQELQERQFAGEGWQQLAYEIVSQLPEEVYISFDIDGLDPKLCPATGTPVPGGLSFQQAIYLIKTVVQSGRKIIGFDLCEVAPGEDEWNGNVGARVLYHLANLAGASRGWLHSTF